MTDKELEREKEIETWNLFVDAVMRLMPDSRDEALERIKEQEERWARLRELEKEFDKILFD